MWQDFLLASANWILLASLIPTLLHRTYKPTLSTSILTGACLSAIALSYASLSLWSATGAVSLNAAAWFILAYQRYKLDKSQSKPN